MPDFVSLDSIWRNKGIVMMPDSVLWMCYKAFTGMRQGLLADGPTSVELRRQFAASCKRWLTSPEDRAEVRLDEVLGSLNFESIPTWPVPVFRPPVISSILVDADTLFSDMPVVQARPTTEQEFKWDGYPYATCIYWALMFHEETAFLQRPQIIWSRVLHQVGRWCSWDVQFGSESRWPPTSMQMAMYALYERALGLRYDGLTNVPHFKTNISERPDIRDQTERDARIKAYFRAVEFLLNTVTESILDS